MILLDPRIPRADSPNFLVRLYELFKEYAKEINNILLTVKGRLLSVDAGSASATSISFDGDDNTGIYSPGADQIGFSTSGTQRMTIDSSGNVGIGTGASTLSNRLTVKQSTDTGVSAYGLRLERQANDSMMFVGYRDNTSTWQIYASYLSTGAYAPITLHTGDAERMRIDASGNVIQNVNTSAPTLPTNQQMVFALTSNTNLRVSVRGTDGTTRVANITLA